MKTLELREMETGQRGEDDPSEEMPGGERSDFDGFVAVEQVEGLLAPVLRIEGVEAGPGHAMLYGLPQPDAAHAFGQAAAAAWGEGWEIWLVEHGRVAAHVRPRTGRSAPVGRRPLWNIALLLATLVTTTWAGALHRGVDLLAEPGRWAVGLPYALALLAILGVHELGHYIAARRHRIPVSLPYFIPAPFFLGTFGAFIRMGASARSRNAYFDVSVAGPLAGLVVAVLAIALGAAAYAPGGGPGMDPDSSLLFSLLYRWAGGPAGQGPVALGPIAFAGWLGLLVTALNLLPVGQLDGGHITYALLGARRARALGTVVIGALVALGFLYSPHWLMWAAVVWALGGVGHPPRPQRAGAPESGASVAGLGDVRRLGGDRDPHAVMREEGTHSCA